MKTEDEKGRTTVTAQKVMRTKTFWISVLGSIVATALYPKIVAPLLKWAGDATGGLFGSWMDGLYSFAARGTREWIPSVILQEALTLTIFLLLFLPPFFRRVYKNKPAFKQEWLRSRLVFNVLRVFVIVMCLDLLASVTADTQLNSRFDRRLRILAPYVPEHELLIWQSEWVQMDNRRDYLHIVQEMHHYADSLHIDIKKSPWD